jgi:hypothetical protein
MKTSEQALKKVGFRPRARIKAAAALIKRGRGVLKRAPQDKPLTEDWAEHKKRERALEERHVR